MKLKINRDRFTHHLLPLGGACLPAGRAGWGFLFLFLTACGNNTNTNNNDKGHILPTSIVNNPHTANGLDPVVAAMKPTLDLKDTLHDFGSMYADEVVEYDFAFTNNGKSPLLITSAFGSCGCTVPDYPHEEIAPGKSGIMKVTFNSAGKSGHQEKTVTIHANTVRGTHMLYIKADVNPRTK